MKTKEQFKVGDRVVSLYDLSDYDGSPFHKGETGVIVFATRSTIHVRDERWHTHIRYRHDFELEKIG